MRNLLLLVVCCAVASLHAQSSAPPGSQAESAGQTSNSTETEAIISAEQKFWDLLVTADYEQLGNLLSPDFILVTSKIRDRTAFLNELRADLNECPIAPVQVNSPQVKLVSPDVATMAASEVIASTCKNREVKITSTTITVWVRREGTWRMHLRSQLLANGFAVQGN